MESELGIFVDDSPMFKNSSTNELVHTCNQHSGMLWNVASKKESIQLFLTFNSFTIVKVPTINILWSTIGHNLIWASYIYFRSKAGCPAVSDSFLISHGNNFAQVRSIMDKQNFKNLQEVQQYPDLSILSTPNLQSLHHRDSGHIQQNLSIIDLSEKRLKGTDTPPTGSPQVAIHAFLYC